MHKFLTISILALLPFIGHTQAVDSSINLTDYYNKRTHFGFILSLNELYLQSQPINNLASHFNDTLKSVKTLGQTGFNLGLVAELKLCRYLQLRFVPDLAFAARGLLYSFKGVKEHTNTLLMAATFLDFPLDLRFAPKRFRDIEPYLLAGGEYTTNLARGVGAIGSLKQNDYACEAGVGISFFLPYFRFGLEAKYSIGLNNLLVQDGSVYTEALQSVKSQVLLISFCFEG